jgi:hypothetical protein
MAFYFGLDARKSFKTNRFWNGLLSLALCFAPPILAGIGSNEGYGGNLGANLIAPIAAFVIFASAQTLMTASWYGPSDKTWFVSFVYYLWTTVAPYIFVGIVALIIVDRFSAEIIQLGRGAESVFIVALGAYVVALGAYWLLRAAQLATFSRNSEQTWSDRFLESGGALFGLSMMRVILAVLAVLCGNAGLMYLGIE